MEAHDVEAVYERMRQRVLDADVVHLSYPKSGRTWVRFFLQHYYHFAFSMPFDVRPATIRGPNLRPSISFSEGFMDVYADEPKRPEVLFREEMDDRRVIGLFRDPRDVTVSYFHWANGRLRGPSRPYLPAGPIEHFAASSVYGLRRCAMLQVMQLDYVESRGDAGLVLQYEQLRSFPTREFRRLVEWLLGEPADEACLARAVEAASFPMMRALEEQVSRQGWTKEYGRIGVDGWDGDETILKVRRGAVGGHRQEMPEWLQRWALDEPYLVEWLERLGGHGDAEGSASPFR